MSEAIAPLMAVIDAYEAATGLPDSTVSSRVFSDGRKVGHLRGGSTITMDPLPLRRCGGSRPIGRSAHMVARRSTASLRASGMIAPHQRGPSQIVHRTEKVRSPNATTARSTKAAVASAPLDPVSLFMIAEPDEVCGNLT